MELSSSAQLHELSQGETAEGSTITMNSSVATDIPQGTVTNTTEFPPLTALDRCDHGDCGAQARARAHFSLTGYQLLFCMHHTNVLRAGLISTGANIVEYFEGLNVRPGASA